MVPTGKPLSIFDSILFISIALDTMAACGIAADEGGANAKCGKMMALAELYQRSVSLGKCDGVAFRSNIHEYKWIDTQSGYEKTGIDCRCTLLAKDDHSRYWTMREGDMGAFKQAEAKFQAV